MFEPVDIHDASAAEDIGQTEYALQLHAVLLRAMRAMLQTQRVQREEEHPALAAVVEELAEVDTRIAQLPDDDEDGPSSRPRRSRTSRRTRPRRASATPGSPIRSTAWARGQRLHVDAMIVVIDDPSRNARAHKNVRRDEARAEGLFSRRPVLS